MGDFYYFDIETQGMDWKKDKIISIQLQKIWADGKPKEELVILKEWTSSEEEILRSACDILLSENIWFAIPVSYNIIFDLTFLFERAKIKGITIPCTLSEYLYNKPMVDLKHLLIMTNGLNFKGAGLDKMTNKKTNGRDIPLWFKNKEYSKIEEYIDDETKSFLEFFQKCMLHLTQLRK